MTLESHEVKEIVVITSSFRVKSVLTAATVLLTAILSVSAGSAPNLLLNSGFETAGSINNIPNWTFWRAPWGSGESAQTTTLYKVNGSRGLMLTCSSSSFGVYQEVTVTPGKAYQMDGWWKGSFPAGQQSWYDCELLDGPFDYVTADQRPDDLPTKICSYDIATASWDWEKMSSVYYTAPICKNGIRVASGTKMTVVLKTGGFSHPYGYYDDISLIEVPTMSVADAKKQPDGTAVMLQGDIVTAIFSGSFYVQSPTRQCAIQVRTTSVFPMLGKTAKVAGVIKTNSAGERYIEASYASFY